MVRPIVHGNSAIHDGKPRQGPMVHGFDYALFNRRNEVSWDNSTYDLVLKFKSFSARQGCELQPAITVLAMPSGLLFVLPLRLCRGANGFSVRNLRHMKHYFRTEFPPQFFERKIDVQLAHSAQHHFLGIGMSRKLERGIFFY